MPTYQSDYNEVTSQRKKAAEAGRKSARYTGAAGSFENELRERLRRRDVERGESQLTEMAGSLREEYAGAGAEIHEDYGAVDPLKRTSLIQQRQAQILGQLEKVGRGRQNREQGISDLVGMAAKGVQAESQAVQAEAGAEEQAYQNMWGEYQFQQQQALQRDQLARQGALTEYQKWQMSQEEAKGGKPELPADATKKIADLSGLLTDLQGLRGGFGEDTGWLKSKVTGTTGPAAALSSILGFGNLVGGEGGERTRVDLERVSSKWRKGDYGTALSESEQKLSRKFLPGRQLQEVQNTTRIDSLLEGKRNELVTLLGTHGISPEMFRVFYPELADVNLDGGGQGSNQVNDPLGIL